MLIELNCKKRKNNTLLNTKNYNSLSVALMQPYVFPYLGYFQLIHAVDKFIFLDDVRFIKKGWIHRNNILLKGSKHRITIPIQKISANKTILITCISKTPLGWETKLLKTLHHAYGKASHFDVVFQLVEKILINCAQLPIGVLARQSIEMVFNYLSIEKKMIETSSVYDNSKMNLHDRIVDICNQETAQIYINSVGGQAFLKKDFFDAQNIELKFLKPNLKPYAQNATNFIAGLSIIDVLMHNSPDKIRDMFSNYTLI